MMRFGIVYRFGDVLLAHVPFVDTHTVKVRPCVVLFQEQGNIVVVGITSNKNMCGIPLSKKEGMVVDSVIKVNYVFTIAEMMVKKKLLELSESKKKMVRDTLMKKLC